ncbi:MAG: phosphonate ABC transporter, permease protein PhnE [Anaerolineales bacterium]|nr:phosphonate ABC transporter, permease protein PhnE [Anaerolineales bacterium]
MNQQRRKSQQESKPSRVPPFLAALLSLVLPGLGQMLVGAFRRGLLLFVSFITIVGLLVWRIDLAARRDVGALAKIQKAFHLQSLLIFLAAAVVFVYLWIVIDAYLTAKRSERQNSSTIGLWAIILITYFFLGWQIGEINLVTMVTQAKDAAPFMSKILWPWDAAIERAEILLTGAVGVQVPCTETPLPPGEETPGQPFLSVEPNCGELSLQDGTPGTMLKLSGKNFAPNDETEIWWEDPIGNEFRARQAGDYIKLITDENGEFQIDVVMPYRLLPSSAAKEIMVWQVQARQVAAVGPATPSTELLLAIEKMIETIFLGMMATFFGIIFSVPVSFLAARNLMSGSWVTLTAYYATRTVLNIIRSIEPLIWAVIAVVVVGLGPFAGILALTIHTIAALGKLYSEAIESIDPGPIEAIQATGANWLQTIMFAVVPQIIPPFVSFTIYRWDINVRMSTVIGLVGGGGIGFLLMQWIRLLDYRSAGIAVWFIAITVAILDYVSAEIRERFV